MDSSDNWLSPSQDQDLVGQLLQQVVELSKKLDHLHTMMDALEKSLSQQLTEVQNILDEIDAKLAEADFSY